MSYYYSDYYEPSAISLLFGSAGFLIFSLLIGAATIAAMWMIFEKAGEPGWAALVPFYNLYVLYKITWGNGWMFLLLLIPFAGFVFQIITWVKLAKVFGKGGGWACGLIFLNTIFICIMGFSKQITYLGIPGAGGQYAPPPGGYQQNNQGYQNPYSQGYQNTGYQQNTQNYGYQQPNQGYQPPPPPVYQQSGQNAEYFYQAQEPAPAPATEQPAPEQPVAKFCASCGGALDETVKFCPKCGAPRG